MSLRAIMDELAATLETALGDQVQQVVGRLNPDPSPPTIDIYPGDPFGEPEGAGFGDILGSYTFTVRARVNTADHEGGQDTLLDLMDADGDLSIAAILQDDQTLNGHASTVRVTGPTGFRRYVEANGQTSLLGCEWAVTVLPEFS